MRQILFRGKRKDGKEWVYGDFSKISESAFISNKSSDYRIMSLTSAEATIKFTRVALETVGQYIGLNDKNGKKIFEDDICYITTHDGTYEEVVVKFIENLGAFKLVDCVNGHLDVANSRLEVIGNIHDKE